MNKEITKEEFIIELTKDVDNFTKWYKENDNINNRITFNKWMKKFDLSINRDR